MKNKIISLLQEAQDLATSNLGIKNLSRPGVIRDLVMSGALGLEFGRQDVLYIAATRVTGVRPCQEYQFQIPDAAGKKCRTPFPNINLCYFGFFDGLRVLEIWELPITKILGRFVMTPGTVKQIGRQVYPPPAQPTTP